MDIRSVVDRRLMRLFVCMYSVNIVPMKGIYNFSKGFGLRTFSGVYGAPLC